MNRFNLKLPGSAFAVVIAEMNSTRRKETVTKNRHQAFLSFENLLARIAAILCGSQMRTIIAPYFAVNSVKKTIGSMAI